MVGILIHASNMKTTLNVVSSVQNVLTEQWASQGTCYVFKDTYDCGTDVKSIHGKKETEFKCGDLFVAWVTVPR